MRLDDYLYDLMELLNKSIGIRYIDRYKDLGEMDQADLKSFIVGSSWPVFILFFLAVQSVTTGERNYSYEGYTILAPFYLGVLNMIGRRLFGGTGVMRFWWTGVLSGILVMIYARLSGSYNFDQKEWLKYSVYIVIKHIIVHSVIIGGIEKLLGIKPK